MNNDLYYNNFSLSSQNIVIYFNRNVAEHRRPWSVFT